MSEKTSSKPWVKSKPPKPPALRALECGMTEAIVLRAPLRIGKNLVGLVEFLEFFLGVLCRRDCGRDETESRGGGRLS